jgi:hypothetical protein
MEKNSKLAMGSENPMWAAGFMHETQVREVWQLGDDYWREWLRTNRVPYRTIGRVRWFHRDSLVQWFLMRPGSDDEKDFGAGGSD